MKTLDVTLEELLNAGVHFGHQIHRWNPKMSRFIYGKQGGVHIFDLATTREALLTALEVLAKASQEGKLILFVGTKKQAKEELLKLSVDLGVAYVAERWLGGTLTNFEQIHQSVRHMAELKTKLNDGSLTGYTKKEKLLLSRRIDKMDVVFGGLTNLNRLPDIVFIVDTHREKSAVAEAIKMNIPIVGVVDTNADPTGITYPIPMNDDASSSLELLFKLVRQAMKPAVKTDPTKPAKKAKPKDVKEPHVYD